MRSKNSRPLTDAERAHLEWVKEQPCSVCELPGPSDAHHIEQGQHFTTIPLCKDCHQGSRNGLHGQRFMWSALKKTELSCLNDTIRRLAAERR